MTQKRHTVYLLPMVPVILFAVMFLLQPVHANEGMSNLTAKVAALNLGINGYIIGSKLSPEQKNIASANSINDAYEGTFKFKDAELFVVAAQEDDTVLAVYQRNEKAKIDQARTMISGLMGLFGEPTAMAHDKLIYWAYNDQGKIPEASYNKLREKGEKFEVLATVKLNSTLSITDDNPDPEENGTVYFIISSDPLIQEFIELD